MDEKNPSEVINALQKKSEAIFGKQLECIDALLKTDIATLNLKSRIELLGALNAFNNDVLVPMTCNLIRLLNDIAENREETDEE